MIIGMPGERWDGVPAGDRARVIEVCQACRQYAEVAYTRWHPAPEVNG